MIAEHLREDQKEDKKMNKEQFAKGQTDTKKKMNLCSEICSRKTMKEACQERQTKECRERKMSR